MSPVSRFAHLFRRRHQPPDQGRADLLDQAITAMQRGDDVSGRTRSRELRAAEAVARQAHAAPPAPPEPLVALRAALAARRAARAGGGRRLVAVARLAPAAALAVLVFSLAVASQVGDFVPGGDTRTLSIETAADQADEYVAELERQIEVLKQALTAGDPQRAQEAALAAQAAAARAEGAASVLPQSNPTRQQVLQTKERALADLTRLVGSPGELAPAVTTTSSTSLLPATSTSSTTSTTTPPSTTTTRPPPTSTTKPPRPTSTVLPTTTTTTSTTTPPPTDDPGTGNSGFGG